MKTLHIDEDHVLIRKELDDLLGTLRPERLAWSAAEFARLRKCSGLTQSVLADITGVKQPAISAVETGRIRKTEEGVDGEEKPAPTMNIETLYVLARAIGAELGNIAVLPIPSDTGLSAEQIRELHPQLLEVEKITTLIHPGAKTYLRDIYYRTLLIDESIPRGSDDRIVFQIERLTDLKHSASVVLGRAGQGKSILLRYLTIQESNEAVSLPLFFELRKWGAEPVKEQILKQLKIWKLAEYTQELDSLLEEGRLSLLFDAFDELSIERRQDFLSELSDLHAEYPELRIVVSARPDSGILSCSWLHPYSIQPLNFTDVEALIRIYAAKEYVEVIAKRVKNADIKVIDLLRSPIFVVLLIIRFEYSQQIPRNIVAFYADLFDALVRRHNQDVGGLKRKISSKLQPRELEKAFKLICFLLHQRFGDQPAHIRTVEDIAEEYTRRCALPSKTPTLIVDDIIRITNLMLEEAGMCEFIHKSVKEYYAAAYIIENMTDEQAELFYSELQTNWRGWIGVLWFLEQVDRFRYLRFFAIPGLRRFAPYQAVQIAKSFRKVRIIGNEAEGFTFQFPLHETDCFALARQKQFTLFSSANLSEFQALFGDKEADRICHELENVHDISVDWQECHRPCEGEEFKNSPIVNRLWRKTEEKEFDDLIQSWEQEVQEIRSTDADFEMG